MAVYSIDSNKQALRATGVVQPVNEWVEDAATGKRRQSDQQARTDHGVPLWTVEVTYQAESWGRVSTVVAPVTVPSPTLPGVAAFEPVAFDGLTVSVSVVKANGSLRESWRAEGITGQSGRESKAA